MTSQANSEDSTHLEEGTDVNDDKPTTKAETSNENLSLKDKVKIEEDPENHEEVEIVDTAELSSCTGQEESTTGINMKELINLSDMYQKIEAL